MMEIRDYASRDDWEKRTEWISDEIEKVDIGLVYSVSDHSTALFMDMQIAFSCGAWISVVVMSISVIDSHLRETEALDDRAGTAKLLDKYYLGNDINWLRQLRNRYVHHDVDKPFFKMNEWFNNQQELEANAYKAMQMTISALFQNPGI
jgi:hypothetical protein